MKKLSALILTLLILMLAGCKSNATESGTVSDFQSDTAVIKNSSTVETDNNSSEENSSKDESVTDAANINSVNPPVNSKNNNNKNSTVSKTEKPNVSNNPSTNAENNSNKTEIKAIKFYEVTTYYGFTGYFCTIQGDIILKELGLGNDNQNAAKGITEYYNIDTGEPIFFCVNSTKATDRDIAEKTDENAGRAKIPVKVINDRKYEKFNQPLEKYIIFDVKRDTSSYGPIRKVVLYTTTPNTNEMTAKIKKQIKTVFYKNFGHYSPEEPEYSIVDIFHIDDTEKLYRVFEYYLEEHYSLSEEECPPNTFYQHAWLADNSGNKIAGSDEYMDMGKVYDTNGNFLFSLKTFSAVDFEYWSATKK